MTSRISPIFSLVLCLLVISTSLTSCDHRRNLMGTWVGLQSCPGQAPVSVRVIISRSQVDNDKFVLDYRAEATGFSFVVTGTCTDKIWEVENTVVTSSDGTNINFSGLGDFTKETLQGNAIIDGSDCIWNLSLL